MTTADKHTPETAQGVTGKGSVTVRRVSTRSDAANFLSFPEQLYAHDRDWVCPLRSVEKARWSARHNASLAKRKTARWLARHGDEVVGRIAAIADPEFARRWDKSAGFFGFFESIDDADVARALVDTARSQLSAWGFSRCYGPVNLTTHDEVGILVRGFRTPSILSPYNPPYYEQLLQRAGCEPARDYHCFDWDVDIGVRKVNWNRAARAGVQIRSADPKHWDRDARIIWELYNASFQHNWGFTSMSWEEFSERAQGFSRFYDPELILIAHIDGEPAGFLLFLPDVNRALVRFRNRFSPLGWLRFVRDIKHLDHGRLILMGSLPAHQGKGLGALLAARLGELIVPRGIVSVDVSLIDSDNKEMRSVIARFNVKAGKTYRLFVASAEA